MPIYIHPGIPPDKVREVHYDGLPGNLSFTLPLTACGWHMKTAIHVLRLVPSPTIRVFRWSSVIWMRLPFMLDRIDETTATEANRCSGVRCGKPSSITSDRDQRVLHDGAVHGRAHDVRGRSHHVLSRLSAPVKCAGGGVSGCATRVAGGPSENHAWQSGPTAAVADLSRTASPEYPTIAGKLRRQAIISRHTWQNAGLLSLPLGQLRETLLPSDEEFCWTLMKRGHETWASCRFTTPRSIEIVQGRRTAPGELRSRRRREQMP